MTNQLTPTFKNVGDCSPKPPPRIHAPVHNYNKKTVAGYCLNTRRSFKMARISAKQFQYTSGSAAELSSTNYYATRMRTTYFSIPSRTP